MEYHLKPNALVAYAESFSQLICDQFFDLHEQVSGRDLVRMTTVPQVNAFLVKAVFEGWQQEAANIQSPLFNYSSPAVKEQMSSLMKTLSSNISISREHIEPMITQAVVDTFILTFNPKQYFRVLFGKLSSTINPERDLKPRLKYTKLHPQFIEKTYSIIQRAGGEIKLKAANEIMEHTAEDAELFSDPELVAKQFQSIKEFVINDLVSDWYIEPTPIMGIPSDPHSAEEHDDAPEIDESFHEKNEHYDDEDYIPEEEEMAVYLEEDINSEEAFIGDEERVLTEADLNGTEVPHHDDTDMVRHEERPSLDDDSTANLIDAQPNLTLGEELESTAAVPNVERAEVPDFESDDDDDSTNDEETFTSRNISTSPESNESNEEDTSHSQPPVMELESSKSYPPLKGTIPLHLKFKFQNELFNGNNADFNAAIEIIDQCKDYHTAIALVKEKYIRALDWDLGAESTRDFLSMIDKKFE